MYGLRVVRLHTGIQVFPKKGFSWPYFLCIALSIREVCPIFMSSFFVQIKLKTGKNTLFPSIFLDFPTAPSKSSAYFFPIF